MPLINLISSIIWILPLYKNYKGKYFYFFLINAASDPLFFFLPGIIKVNPNLLIILIDILIILFWNREQVSLGRSLKTLALILFLVLLMFISLGKTNYIIMLLDFWVIGLLFNELLTQILIQRKLNIFVALLAAYYLLIALNTIFITFNPLKGVDHFFNTLTLMMFCGAFFSFFNEKSKILLINLKKM